MILSRPNSSGGWAGQQNLPNTSTAGPSNASIAVPPDSEIPSGRGAEEERRNQREEDNAHGKSEADWPTKPNSKCQQGMGWARGIVTGAVDNVQASGSAPNSSKQHLRLAVGEAQHGRARTCAQMHALVERESRAG